MYFLVDICDNSTTLRLFYTIKIIFYILQILIPLLCIFMTLKRVLSAMTSDNTEKGLKELIPQSAKMLFVAFLFFFVPTIVEYAVNTLADQNVDFAYCFVEATLDNIDYYKELEAEERKKAAEEVNKELEAATKEQRAEEKKKIEEKKASQNKTNVTRVNETAVLANGTSNKYFAPLQNASYNFGVKNLTGGCSNEVYHDLPVATGTPIYAGMTGTVTYYQYTCGSTLYGYGNLAVLTAPDGTYINYAHLSQVPTGLNFKYTNSCPKKADNSEPCPSSACSSEITKTVLGTRTVKKGQVLGYTGDTGNSTGPHLHVEIHENGSSYCVTDPFAAFGMR